MNRQALTALVACLGMTLVLPAWAQWKWRDKAGHTQYSDLPPPNGVPESDILQKPAGAQRRAAPAEPASAASAAPLAAARPSDPELEARRKKAEQKAEQEIADKKKAEDAKVAAAKAENCGRAKEQMRTLDSGQRMVRTNEKGEREYLDDAARAAEAKRTRDVMASDCK